MGADRSENLLKICNRLDKIYDQNTTQTKQCCHITDILYYNKVRYDEPSHLSMNVNSNINVILCW